MSHPYVSSGAVEIDPESGLPVILYTGSLTWTADVVGSSTTSSRRHTIQTHRTLSPRPAVSGVYLKSNREAVAALGLPPPESDLGLRFAETQLAAVPADAGGLLRCMLWLQLRIPQQPAVENYCPAT
jgi:hypothetical protein